MILLRLSNTGHSTRVRRDAHSSGRPDTLTSCCAEYNRYNALSEFPYLQLTTLPPPAIRKCPNRSTFWRMTLISIPLLCLQTDECCSCSIIDFHRFDSIARDANAKELCYFALFEHWSIRRSQVRLRTRPSGRTYWFYVVQCIET